jgi:hypothetical protein
VKNTLFFKLLLLVAASLSGGHFTSPFLHAADTVSLILAASEKISLSKQLNSSAQTAGLTSINAYFHQRVSALADAALRNEKSPLPPEFIYAVTGSEFFSRITAEDFKCLQHADRAQVAEFLHWFYNNPEIMLHFNELGPVADDPKTWFSDWFEVWSRQKGTRDGLGRKTALVLAHVNA